VRISKKSRCRGKRKHALRVRGKQRKNTHTEVDAIVEGNNAPLVELPSAEASETDKKIANQILNHLQEGVVFSLELAPCRYAGKNNQ
jgi:hypothetical protein